MLERKKKPDLFNMMRRNINYVPFNNVFGNARCGFESRCCRVLVFNAFEIPNYYLYKLDLRVLCTTDMSTFCVKILT